jgi:hypothetical protein
LAGRKLGEMSSSCETRVSTRKEKAAHWNGMDSFSLCGGKDNGYVRVNVISFKFIRKEVVKL